MANSLDNDYQKLLKQVLTRGVVKTDRTGTGTKSIFGASIRHDMSDGFPILTTKKIAFKTMVTELKWFLRGDTNIKYLQDNNCKIWDGDYKKSGNRNGELGPIYGKQWRDWRNYDRDYYNFDQIKILINNLKNNPDSRRLLVSSWNVSDLDKMTLPPCHYSFQCYVADGKLSLMWNQRSADLFLGVPFNISSYGLLLLLLCKETRLEPGELIGNFGDVHLYSNHLDQAEEQLDRYSYDLPEVSILLHDILKGEFDVNLFNYEYHPAIKAPLSN